MSISAVLRATVGSIACIVTQGFLIVIFFTNFQYSFFGLFKSFFRISVEKYIGVTIGIYIGM
jgi:hypothetical protein